MSQCPSENSFAEFLEGRLTDTARDAFDEHVRGCARCEATLAALLEPEPSRPTAPISSTRALEGSPEMPSQVGELPWQASSVVAGRYSILEVIGIGGMGIVYSALDTKLQRKVALKVTRTELSRANALRLYREAQAMAQLSHRNVVAVHDVGMWHDHVFLAMEYMEGGTLNRYLLTRELAWPEVLERFVEAGHGLAAAHEAGVVHRDFKPDNVLLGASNEVKVADFGLACVLGDTPAANPAGLGASTLEPNDALRAHLTRLGTVLGTPGYMAPEQIRGELVDHRADIWSFSAALYEAVYCELPFPGRTPREVLRYAEAGRFRRAPRGSNVPQWLRNALLAGLRADPAERIPTMQELLELLERRRRMYGGRGRIFWIAGLVGGLVGIVALAVRHEPHADSGRTKVGSASAGPAAERGSSSTLMGSTPSSLDVNDAPASAVEHPGATASGKDTAALPSHPGEAPDGGSAWRPAHDSLHAQPSRPSAARVRTAGHGVAVASATPRAQASARELRTQPSTRSFPLSTAAMPIPEPAASPDAPPAGSGASRPVPPPSREAPIILD